jgi:hypothetical protein
MVDHVLKAEGARLGFQPMILNPRHDRFLTIEAIDGGRGGLLFIIKDARGEPLAQAALDYNSARNLICRGAEMLGGSVTEGRKP